MHLDQYAKIELIENREADFNFENVFHEINKDDNNDKNSSD